MAYERIEGPLGLDRSDFHSAQVTAAIYEVNRDRKKRKRVFRAKDFMPEWDQPEEDFDVQVQKEKGIFHRIAAAFTRKE